MFPIVGGVISMALSKALHIQSSSIDGDSSSTGKMKDSAGSFTVIFFQLCIF